MLKDILKNVYYFIHNKLSFIYRDYERQIVRSAEKKNLGELNNDKILYIIKRSNQAGFFSNYFFVIGHCMVAEKRGWIPVVDMKNYSTPYNEDVPIDGTMNSWEYYFSQPSNISLEDAYHSKQILFSSDIYPHGIVPSYGIGFGGKLGSEKITEIHKALSKYAKIKNDLVSEFESELSSMGIASCVGVHVRGTDMKHTAAHPLPPKLEKVFATVDEILKQYKKKGLKVFLCSDEENIVKEFYNKYGDGLVTTRSYRSTDGMQGIHVETGKCKRDKHRYLLGKEVLRDVYFLSKCKYFVGCRSNVSYAAIVMNNNFYEKTEIVI